MSTYKSCKEQNWKNLQKYNKKNKLSLPKKLKLQQWKSTNTAIKWFKYINNKDNSKFIQLAIKDFYHSVTEEPLETATVFAQTNTNIHNDDIQIIKHSRKSLLFHKQKHGKMYLNLASMLL